MTEAEAATTTTTNATLNHQLENEPNHDSPPPNQHHPEIKSTSSNISASNNNNNNNSMINNPTPHRLPEGENAAPLEVIGTTTSDKLVIIMVGLPATGTCMCVCVYRRDVGNHMVIKRMKTPLNTTIHNLLFLFASCCFWIQGKPTLRNEFAVSYHSFMTFPRKYSTWGIIDVNCVAPYNPPSGTTPITFRV